MLRAGDEKGKNSNTGRRQHRLAFAPKLRQVADGGTPRTGAPPSASGSGTLQAQGRPVLELHAQGQATCGKDFLDFVERLATQVRGLEQLVFRTLDEIADVVDV